MVNDHLLNNLLDWQKAILCPRCGSDKRNGLLVGCDVEQHPWHYAAFALMAGVAAAPPTPPTSVAQLCDELRHEVELLTPKQWLLSLDYEPDKPMPPEVYLPLMKQYADYRLGPIVERIRMREAASHPAPKEKE